MGSVPGVPTPVPGPHPPELARVSQGMLLSQCLRMVLHSGSWYGGQETVRSESETQTGACPALAKCAQEAPPPGPGSLCEEGVVSEYLPVPANCKMF